MEGKSVGHFKHNTLGRIGVEDNNLLHKMKWSCLWFIMKNVVLCKHETNNLYSGGNDHWNQNLLKFNFCCWLIWSGHQFFADGAALFRVITTDITNIHHYCRGNTSYYLHDQISHWFIIDNSHYSWIALQLDIGTFLGRCRNKVWFQIRDQFWNPQPKLHG